MIAVADSQLIPGHDWTYQESKEHASQERIEGRVHVLQHESDKERDRLQLISDSFQAHSLGVK